ncbi:MAG: MBOAT family protein, partial [Gemmatimonadota bacterium]
ERLPRVRDSTVLLVLRVLLTFHLILVTWVFFRAKTVNDAWLILSKIGANLANIPGLIAKFPFTTDHWLGLALIAFLLVIEVLDERRPILQRLNAAPVALRWAAYYLAIFLLLVVGRWQAREFIYMQF